MYILPLSASVTPSVTLTSYYSAANGKSSNNLRTSLGTIISTNKGSGSAHKVVIYDNLGYLLKYADTENADGTTLIDIYSPCTFTISGTSITWSSTCSGKNNVGCGLNREHTVPQSWFDKASPMVSDAFHIYAVDAASNGHRSNNHYGECSGGTSYTGGSCNESGKLGASTLAGTYTYNGTTYSTTAYSGSGSVYEPADEYKGDIARGFFYMATRYNSACSGWGEMFGDVNGLTQYTVDLMLKWHRLDPVSEKELIRNEVIYGNTTYNKVGGSYYQGNRNPFIDYPCLVEYIWGDSVGKSVDITKLVSAYDASFSLEGCPCSSSSTTPAITSPTSNVDFGATNTSTAVTKSIHVKGVNLTGNLTLTISGSSFFLINGTSSTTTVTQANALAGKSINIVYTPSTNGSHSATLTISGGGLASPHTITLTGSCSTSYTVTWMADGAPYHSNTAVSGSSPSVPEAPDDCGATRVFRGWTASSSHSGNSAPADMFTTSAPSVTKTTTYYAVYADKGSSGSGTVNTTVSMNSFNATFGNVEDDSNVSYIAAQGSAGTAPAIYSNMIRIYQNGGTLTISANNSKKLTSITIGSSMATSVSYSVDGGSASANQSISANGTYTLDGIEASTVVFTCKGTTSSSRLYLNKLSVTYSGTGSTTTYSNYSLYCSTAPVTATATFMNNGATFATQSGTAGTPITIDDPTPCAGYTFEGWSTHEYATGNTEAAVIDFAGTIPYTNTTYYAVYSKTVSGGSTLTNNYKKITTAGELTSGNYLIVGNSSGYQAMSTTWKDTYYLSPTAVTPESDVITTTDATIVWTITVSGSQVTISNADAGNLYIEQSGSHYNIKLGDNTTDNKFTYSVTDGNWLFRSATYTDRVLEYYSSRSRWAYYTSADAPVYLYKQQSEATGTTYHTTSPDCTCRVTVTVVSDDESQGTVSITAL
ncbi:MAG: endonuclease [Paludibacteraceae bacterium]|nr:endonuclease [Paludibacteraceae bacterium]